MTWRRAFQLLGRVFALWSAHSASRLGAALAYYMLLSLAPLMILIVAIAAIPFGETFARRDTLTEAQRVIGVQGSMVIQSLLADAYHSPTSGWGATAAISILLFGASSVFAELRSALNIIWDIPDPPSGYVRGLIKERLVALGMILTVGIMMTVFLAASVGVSMFREFFANQLSVPVALLNIANYVLSFALLSAIFCLMFRFVPSARIGWEDAWVGALFTAVLLALSRIPLDLYLTHAGVGSSYGAAGSLIAFLFWVYCSAQIFYLGGEVTRVYAEEFGSLSHRIELQ